MMPGHTREWKVAFALHDDNKPLQRELICQLQLRGRWCIGCASGEGAFSSLSAVFPSIVLIDCHVGNITPFDSRKELLWVAL